MYNAFCLNKYNVFLKEHPKSFLNSVYKRRNLARVRGQYKSFCYLHFCASYFELWLWLTYSRNLKVFWAEIKKLKLLPLIKYFKIWLSHEMWTRG